MDTTAVVGILDGGLVALAAVGASLLGLNSTRAVWNAVRGFIK